MAKLQGLLFGLATVVLVVVATVLFMKDWLPPLKSDRGAIDHAHLDLAGRHRRRLHRHQPAAGLVRLPLPGPPGRQGRLLARQPGLEWTWTLVTAVIMFVFLFNALRLWAQVEHAGRPPTRCWSRSPASSSPGTSATRARTASSAGPTTSSASQENPIGLDKADPAAADDIMLLNQLYLPAGPPGARAAPLDGRHPQLLPAQLPREAGRDAGHDDRDLVRAEGGRRLRDRLRRALRPRPLPHARAGARGARPTEFDQALAAAQ